MNQKDYEKLSNHEGKTTTRNKESGIGLFFFKDDDQVIISCFDKQNN